MIILENQHEPETFQSMRKAPKVYMTYLIKQ